MGFCGGVLPCFGLLGLGVCCGCSVGFVGCGAVLCPIGSAGLGFFVVLSVLAVVSSNSASIFAFCSRISERIFGGVGG